MWDLPGPGIEPVSPALAGRFLTTAPPGKFPCVLFTQFLLVVTSCKGIIQCHNQDVDIDTIYQSYSEFPSFVLIVCVCVCVCVCFQFYTVLSHMWVHVSTTMEIHNSSISRRIPVFPFFSHIHLPLTLPTISTIPNPWQSLIYSPFL